MWEINSIFIYYTNDQKILHALRANVQPKPATCGWTMWIDNNEHVQIIILRPVLNTLVFSLVYVYGFVTKEIKMEK